MLPARQRKSKVDSLAYSEGYSEIFFYFGGGGGGGSDSRSIAPFIRINRPHPPWNYSFGRRNPRRRNDSFAKDGRKKSLHWKSHQEVREHNGAFIKFWWNRNNHETNEKKESEMCVIQRISNDESKPSESREHVGNWTDQTSSLNCPRPSLASLSLAPTDFIFWFAHFFPSFCIFDACNCLKGKKDGLKINRFLCYTFIYSEFRFGCSGCVLCAVRSACVCVRCACIFDRIRKWEIFNSKE